MYYFRRGVHRAVGLARTSKNKQKWEQGEEGLKISNFEQTNFWNGPKYSLSIQNV